VSVCVCVGVCVYGVCECVYVCMRVFVCVVGVSTETTLLHFFGNTN
jgi:hypothetical protein